MQVHPRPTLPLPIVGTILLLFLIVVVWVAVPDAQPAILLVAIMADVAFYGVLYVIQRRRHW